MPTWYNVPSLDNWLERIGVAQAILSDIRGLLEDVRQLEAKAGVGGLVAFGNGSVQDVADRIMVGQAYAGSGGGVDYAEGPIYGLVTALRAALYDATDRLSYRYPYRIDNSMYRNLVYFGLTLDANAIQLYAFDKDLISIDVGFTTIQTAYERFVLTGIDLQGGGTHAYAPITVSDSSYDNKLVCAKGSFEYVQQPDFTASTGWTLSGGWSIGGGQATTTNGGEIAALGKDLALALPGGLSVAVIVDVASIDDTLTVMINGIVVGTVASSGVHRIECCTAEPSVERYPGALFPFTYIPYTEPYSHSSIVLSLPSGKSAVLNSVDVVPWCYLRRPMMQLIMSSE